MTKLSTHLRLWFSLLFLLTSALVYPAQVNLDHGKGWVNWRSSYVHFPSVYTWWQRSPPWIDKQEWNVRSVVCHIVEEQTEINKSSFKWKKVLKRSLNSITATEKKKKYNMFVTRWRRFHRPWDATHDMLHCGSHTLAAADIWCTLCKKLIRRFQCSAHSFFNILLLH